jgi:hypothetical protein
MRIGLCSVAVLAMATLMAAQELPRHAVLTATVESLSSQAASQKKGVVVAASNDLWDVVAIIERLSSPPENS